MVTQLDGSKVAERIRQVVADEPKAFAYDIGVSLSAVYNYMNGRIPSTSVLHAIARHTGRSMDWFFDGAEMQVEAVVEPQPVRQKAVVTRLTKRDHRARPASTPLRRVA